MSTFRTVVPRTFSKCPKLRRRLRQSVRLPVRAQHTRDGLSSRLRGRDARYALDDPWLFHEGRVEFGWYCWQHCQHLLDCTADEKDG